MKTTGLPKEDLKLRMCVMSLANLTSFERFLDRSTLAVFAGLALTMAAASVALFV
jgi:hypothetical protein